MHPRQGCTGHFCLMEGFTSRNLHQSCLSDALPKEFVREEGQLVPRELARIHNLLQGPCKPLHNVEYAAREFLSVYR